MVLFLFQVNFSSNTEQAYCEQFRQFNVTTRGLLASIIAVHTEDGVNKWWLVHKMVPERNIW
jgi:hypothetical protein